MTQADVARAWQAERASQLLLPHVDTRGCINERLVRDYYEAREWKILRMARTRVVGATPHHLACLAPRERALYDELVATLQRARQDHGVVSA